MDQLLLCRCRQGTRNLQRDSQGFDWAQRAVSFHVPINGFTVDELHGVEITLVVRAEMKDGCDVLMPKCSRSPGLPQKSLPSHVAAEVRVIDNLKGYERTEVRVEGLVGDAHRT